MTEVDAHVDIAEHPRYRPYLAWWQRCPECAATAPWEPWQTDSEYQDYLIIREIIGLAKPRGRNAIPIGEQISSLGDRLIFHWTRRPSSLWDAALFRLGLEQIEAAYKASRRADRAALHAETSA